MPFTHLDENNRPAMVDVSDKGVTVRTATARATVVLGEGIISALRKTGFTNKKGPITQTAIIAGTMAVKQTSAVIPLCHPLPIHGCTITVAEAGADGLLVKCTVTTEGKTGVEMEALHGASVAALTIYDMCKSMSHAITIEGVQLVRKRGGKSDVDRG